MNGLPWPVDICLASAILFAVVVFLLIALHKIRVTTSGHPWLWLRARLGWGMGVDELARRLDMSPTDVREFQPAFREAWIPKRSGGTRRLLVPDDRTMELQRKLLHRLLKKLRVHAQAKGFEKGSSIVDNAQPHVGRCVIIKLDIVDFFPTTAAKRVQKYFQRIGWNREAASILTRWTTHEGGLPQGAPTSPRISNLVNFGIDERLLRLARKRKGIYTRYADDITFSFPKDYPKRMRGIVQAAAKILRAHGYEVHRDRKYRIIRRHQRQMVTGLVVNDQVSLPRELRRRLRAARHRIATGKGATWSPNQLKGWASLENMVKQQRRQ